MNLEKLINTYQHRFSQTEQDILAFMLENQEFLAETTINQLAHKTYTSTSSIIRLTKKLGFSGFAELKYLVKTSLSQREPTNPNFIASGLSDIKQTLDFLQGYDFSPLLQKIHSARTLYCYGTGYAQHNASQEFAKSLLACGKFTHLIPASRELAASSSVMTATDLLILVSLSGNTPDVEESIKKLSLRKIPMLAITAQSVNYMASTASYVLHYQATPTRLAGADHPYHSFVALNVLLDYLVRRYIEFLEERPAHEGSTELPDRQQ